MQQLFSMLESIAPLGEELAAELAEKLQYRELPRKEYLLKAGHICRNIYFIEQGLLRCFYLKQDAEVSSWFMKEGDVIISIESFYQQKESHESIQAIEDCSLYYLGYTELQAIYRSFPEFNFTGRVLTEKYYTLWAKQLFALRMRQGGERYLWLLEHHADLVLRVPAKFLASYLGISEQYLSMLKSGVPRLKALTKI